MFITETKLRDIIKQVLVDAQIIEEEKSIAPVPTVPPKGWNGGLQPKAKIDINFDTLLYGVHPDKIRSTLGTYTEDAGKSCEEIDHDINSILFRTSTPVSKVDCPDTELGESLIALKAENHRLRRELARAEELLADKIEVIYNMEVYQDVQDEKLVEIEGLLTRAQVVLEGLTSGDYFD